ncbi:MAG: UrcA family protein [Alphaproteobacteria bacterium]|nr:UrcA family protein [Alphaproteobacteria bacterium]MBN9577658.1 UrcA family protein [Alphaproteobacteria bacterium]OJU56316.1 MAG: hypothetical protein BGO00_06450 [Alphaproteobacteria bacterium 62-8]
MNRTLSTIFAITLMAFGAHGADAQTIQASHGVRQVSVSFADLNLNSDQGVAILMNRLESAARTVCGPEPVNMDLTGRAAFKACNDRALGAAVADVGSPRLLAMYGKAPRTRIAAK